MRTPSPELEHFATELSPRAINHRKEPFTLRSGAKSHWYVDHREGLSEGPMIKRAGELLAERTREVGYRFTVVVGNGIAGRMIAMSMALARDKETATKWAIVNDDEKDDDPQNGYGIHGAKVAGQEIVIVDDIGMSGDSIVTTARIACDENGGILVGVANVSDRSEGRTAVRVNEELGVGYTALCTFDEANGLLVPSYEFFPPTTEQ